MINFQKPLDIRWEKRKLIQVQIGEKSYFGEKFGVIVYCPNTLFFNEKLIYIRNLNWDGQIAKKLSVLRKETCIIFFHFQYHNFEGTVTDDMFRKVIFLWY